MEKCTPIEDFEYTIHDNNITLKKYKQNNKEINIASEYNINNKMYHVTEISEYCFSFNNIIKNISLPNSINKIETGIFIQCKNLKNIKLPNNINIITEYMFADCKNLKKIILPEKLETIEKHSFASTKIEQLTLPNTVREINKGAFSNCKNLQFINIPKNIKNIELKAFYNCSNLKLEDFENQYIRIKNNNIYKKEIENNKVIYTLIEYNQNSDTLIIEKNEKLNKIENDKIKNIIIKSPLENEWHIKTKKLNNLIIMEDIKNIDLNEDNIKPKKIKNLYLSDKVNTYIFDGMADIIYCNNTLKNFKTLNKRNLIYNKLVCRKNIEQLLKEDYTFKQIDLIIKGYDKDIILSNVNKDISTNILRDIINHFNYDDIELYDILELLQKEEINLEDNLKIQSLINNKINKDYNIECDGIIR